MTEMSTRTFEMIKHWIFECNVGDASSRCYVNMVVKMKSQKNVQGDNLKQRFSTWVRELLEGVRKKSNFTNKFPFGGTRMPKG